MAHEPITSASDAARLFRRASSEFEKRDVVIRAIDGGVIHVQMPVAELLEVVDKASISKPVEPEDGRVVDVVYFRARLTPPPGMPPLQQGWYMVIHHDGKRIWRYELSNSYEK